MKTFYFSGTGNCLQVARAIGGEVISIPQFLRENREALTDKANKLLVADDAVGLVVPTYWLSLPRVVREFLEKVPIKTDYFFVVTTCGNSALTFKAQLLQLAKQRGIKVAYFKNISMPDNFLPLFDMLKEKRRFTDKQLHEKAGQTASDIHDRKYNVSGFAGLAPLRGFMMNLAARQMGEFDTHFSIEEACDSCGLCTRVCPATNISLEKGVPVYQGNCLACLSCIHLCPKIAIHVQGEKNNERYRNPEIPVSEFLR